MYDFRDVKDYDNIYSGNILDFYKLCKSDDLVNEIINDNNLLFHFYPYKEAMRRLFEKNELYRFLLIDFFSNNVDRILQREQKIKTFLLNNNLERLEFIYSNTAVDFNWREIEKKKIIIEKMITEKELYAHVLLSRTTKLDFKRIINIEDLSIRLILLYYFNIYFKGEKSKKMNIEDTDYEDFIHMAIKYKDMFYIMDSWDDIIFKKSTSLSFECATLSKMMLDVLYYFDTFSLPCQVTKNVISWFYVFFNSIIPKNLHNELLYIMTGIKKNIIGIVMHLLSGLNKEYCNITEEELEGVIDIIKSDYVYKENEEVENKQDIKSYINNLILIDQLRNNGRMKIIKNIRSLYLDKDNLFFINTLDPLKENWNTVEFYIQKINESIPKDPSLVPIFNSISVDVLEPKITVIVSSGLGKFKLGDSLPFLLSQKILDKESLYYHFLLTLSNYEILIFNKEISFRTHISYYQQDINSVKNIFNSVYPKKDFYNGYTGTQ